MYACDACDACENRGLFSEIQAARKDFTCRCGKELKFIDLDSPAPRHFGCAVCRTTKSGYDGVACDVCGQQMTAML